VATDVGGIHEVVDEAWKGRLTPLDDMPAWIEAVLAMLHNLPSRASLAEIGMARTWQATALTYERVLEAAAGGVSSVKL
jgi:glycosyltransferase involved in cell wall biosynthesis